MTDAAQAELTSLPASELAGLIASRRLSATEAVKAHIERIEALNGRLNAVVVTMFVFGPWMLKKLLTFSSTVIGGIPGYF